MKYLRSGCGPVAGLFLLAFANGHGTAAGQQGCPQPLERTSLTIDGKALTVEIAATAPARQCGLAWRRELAHDNGMLFVYRQPALLRFWMRNTFIPLDIAFIDAHWRIINIATMSPHEPFRIHSAWAPAQFALETPAGWFASRGVTAGSLVETALPNTLVVD